MDDVFCPIIPNDDLELITVICSDAHSSALGGHLGTRKMLQFIKSRFYWPNMHIDIKRYCNECITC